MIFDRTFFSEEIYGRLGYKEYSFTSTYEELLKKLDSLNFDIYLIVLYLKDVSTYQERIDSRDKHQYQKFNIESSIAQQKEYLKLADEVEQDTKNIKVIRYNNENSRNYKEKIDKELKFLFE